MKINCDMGESFGAWTMGADAEIMPFIDMANIACGFHASDPKTMTQTIQLAIDSEVSIGAHPSYPDLLGFGRRDMEMAADELTALLIYQIAALDGLCRARGTRVKYVKPHGALYNRMMIDETSFTAVLTAVRDYDPSLPLVVMATPDNEHHLRQADRLSIELLFEAFADRAYDAAGRLANRRLAGAVHDSDAKIADQVSEMIVKGRVLTLEGTQLPIRADTICIHGDGPRALETARFIRELIRSL